MVTKINEGSFSEGDIPNKFWCVIKFRIDDPESMSQLTEMQLKGVKGISSSHEIIFIMYEGSYYQGILVMNGKSVIANNKLSRVLYGNIDYLLSNNLKAYHRLSGASSQPSDFIYDFRNVLMKIKFVLTDPEFAKMFKFRENVVLPDTNNFFGIELLEHIKTNKIKNARDYEKCVMWYFKTLLKVNPQEKGLTSEKIQKILKGLFMSEAENGSTGEISREQEWIVKDNTLNIPRNSQLFLPLPTIPKEVYNRWKHKELTGEDKILHSHRLGMLEEMLKIIKFYDLTSKYKIQFIPQARYNAVRSEYMDASHNDQDVGEDYENRD